jgi:hypothetical protein
MNMFWTIGSRYALLPSYRAAPKAAAEVAEAAQASKITRPGKVAVMALVRRLAL